MSDKYWFNTGKDVKKVKETTWSYGSYRGNLIEVKVDGKKGYFIRKGLFDMSPIFTDKSKFKKKVIRVNEDKPGFCIKKERSLNSVTFNTKIKKGTWCTPDVKLGKDRLSFYGRSDSKILQGLQFKVGDHISITIKKIK